MTMRIVRFNTLDELVPLAEAWNRLAGGVPFRRWQWQSQWWTSYHTARAGRELCVLAVLDALERPIALAPWFIDPCLWRGRILRLLGGDEVCSDYLGLLCTASQIGPVAEALADWLCEQGAAGAATPAWDVLELESVDPQDAATAELLAALGRRGLPIDRQAGPTCWRIDLPPTWEEYLKRLSKSRRKQARRLERRLLDPGQAVLRTVQSAEALEWGWEILVQLHQKRRRALGEAGRFASPRFCAFHQRVMEQLYGDRRLELHWLELDGRPVAAEYQIAGGGCVYAYQAGIDPDAADQEPGTLITVATLRRAIEQGYQAFDFLRGDEEYKRHWRAEPRPSLLVRVAADRLAPRLRFASWRAARALWNTLRRARRRPAPTDEAAADGGPPDDIPHGQAPPAAAPVVPDGGVVHLPQPLPNL